MARLLLIDDDVELCDLLQEYLTTEGFTIEAVHTGDSGLHAVRAWGCDLVILDVMLPGLSGLDVLRRLRETSDVPVLMLTARGEEGDRILGLEIGADDYLPKPFNPRELAARIRAILRRPRAGTVDHTLRVGDLELSLGKRTVRCGGAPVELTAVEFDVLAVLLQHAGEVVDRAVLFESVLERPFLPFDRSIDVHVSKLRKRLGPAADGRERITSVRSVGYTYTALDDGSG